MQPFNAFMNSVGLETLGLRMERLCYNALELAKFFETQDGIEVNYPALEASPYYSLCQKLLKGKRVVWTDNGILYCSNIIWGENIGNVPSR